ncbi:Pherophorin-domain-containing protein [Haematococcus lacustris]
MRCLSFISVLVCTGAVLLAGIASPAAAQPVPAPLQGYPFAVCNHAPGTPYNWTVVRVTSDASFTTIDSVITLKACTRGACCNAQLAKLEWNVGLTCQGSVESVTVNGTSAVWAFSPLAKRSPPRMAFKIMKLLLNTTNAAGVPVQIRLRRSRSCGTASSFFVGNSVAFFDDVPNPRDMCCPAAGFSLP